MSQERHVTETMVPLSFEYKYRVGQAIERFLDGLAAKKILGVRCGKCRRVIVPPRTVCGICNAEMTDWVEVGPEGTIENFTIGRVSIKDGLIQDSEKPCVIAQVRLDKADSLLVAVVRADRIEAVKRGSRVAAVFADEPKGTVHDLAHFRLIG